MKTPSFRRGLTFALASFFTVAIAQPSLAASPHFINASAHLSGSNLVISWKEAGLGDNVLITYTGGGDGTARYVCVNRGGSVPSATNKETVNGPVTATGSFSSGKNGAINGSLTVNPPGPGSFTCPSGQALEVAFVTYTNVSIEDNTNEITQPIPGTFSTGCLLPSVKGACS
jgi:hypothetical protein